jgi:hypothetical protein
MGIKSQLTGLPVYEYALKTHILTYSHTHEQTLVLLAIQVKSSLLGSSAIAIKHVRLATACRPNDQAHKSFIKSLKFFKDFIKPENRKVFFPVFVLNRISIRDTHPTHPKYPCCY